MRGGRGPGRGDAGNCQPPRMPPHRLTPPAPSSGAASPLGPVHSHTQPRLVALPCRPARLPPRRPGPSEAAEGATQAGPCPSLTAVHAEVALGADGLDEAVRPATKGRGERGGSRASGRGAPRPAALSVPSAKQGEEDGSGAPSAPRTLTCWCTCAGHSAGSAAGSWPGRWGTRR